jgi:uncharacterized protein YbjQ (UPF0145 family)
MTYNAISDKMVTTTADLAGFQVIEHLGVVRGIVVRTNNAIGSLFGGIQSMFGGNISVFSEMCDKARADAYLEMLRHAAEKGADAVIAFRYDATELQNGVTEVLAYGTAVKVAPR